MPKIKYILFRILDAKDRITLVTTLFFMFVVALVEVLNIALIGPYIGLILSADFERLNIIINYINVDILPASLQVDNAKVGMLLIGTLLVSGLLSYLANWKLSKVGFHLGYRINAALLKFYNKLPWDTSQQIDREQLLTLFGFDSLRFSNQVLLPIMQLVSKITLAIFIMLTLIYFHTQVALITLIVFGAVYSIIIVSIRKRLVANSKKITHFNQNRLTQLDQTFSGRKILTIHQKTDLFESRFRKSSKFHAKALGENTALSVAPRYIVETLLFILIIAFITVSLIYPQYGSIDLVTLTIFGLAGIKIMPIAQQIYAAIVSIKSNFSTAGDLVQFHQFLVSAYKASDNTTQQPKKVFQSLRLDHCTVKNAQGDNILSDICLEITSGEAVGIIGKSGSGKSTLMNCLAGLVTPHHGRIYLNDVLCDDKLYNLTSVNYVDSAPFIFRCNLYDNVALENNVENPVTKGNIEKIIDKLGLTGSKASIPLDIHLSEDQVSSGQAQRLGIARAMLNDKGDIYFLDEITSALDGASEQIVMDYTYDLINAGKTCVIIAHRLETLKRCDRIVVVDNGKIVEQGSFAELSNGSKFFEAIRGQS